VERWWPRPDILGLAAGLHSYLAKPSHLAKPTRFAVAQRAQSTVAPHTTKIGR
jgi:hypothetical protein